MAKTSRRQHSSAFRISQHQMSHDRATVHQMTPATVTPIEPSAVKLSVRTQRLIDDIQATFTDFTSDFSTMIQARATLAGPFVKAWLAYQKETDGRFVTFVRLLDPTVPMDRAGYRAHSSYQAAENLRSLNRKATEPATPVRNAPVTPLVALSKIVASILPLVDDTGVIWSAFVKQLHWTEPQVKRLQHMVSEEQSLLLNIQQSRRTGTNG